MLDIVSRYYTSCPHVNQEVNRHESKSASLRCKEGCVVVDKSIVRPYEGVDCTAAHKRQVYIARFFLSDNGRYLSES